MSQSDPEAPTSGRIFVYDGHCDFCTSSAARLRKMLPAHVAVEPSQELDIEDLGLSLDDVARASWWIDTEAGVRLEGSEGIAAALQTAGGVPGIAGRLMASAPLRGVSRSLYRQVARNRHRLPGSTDSCCSD